ncbi:cilia- and flagella-associated protein 107 [Neoarius graeffei]|uniref:cilia- and flagella-associated protein 107 n=1 Tax=Neoarius graeffei TaxID=443677 RepID=UPI00298D4ACF|nr:cilia- and flagella-associated protein 107 [Neoarius graeffei]
MQEKDIASDKWKQPGWRIEQKYSNKVLVGNWAEERLQFSQERKTANSSNRLDFKPHTDHRPDVIVRQTALRRSEGLPTRLFFSHHNTPTSHYLVTLYDESYGRHNSSGLPKLRSWHTDKMAWVPEKSDHPLHGPPTNYGLTELWRAQLEKQQAGSHMLSMYRAAYPVHPADAFCQPRHARVPRLTSIRKSNLEINHMPGNAARPMSPSSCD